MTDSSTKNFYKEALIFHSKFPKGKVALEISKPLTNQRDLTLAYSPGVAAPCLEIHKDPLKAFEYTAKGNTVAIISNGTAVLGLGNLGATASKPVMEGKAVLFKRFADIDAVDIEVNTEDQDEFINSIKYIGDSWGGVNLEDIKAPECFTIEEKLQEELGIPVFHDDQHGTAIITAAGLINAAYLTGREFKDLKIVINGAGAAAIAGCELLKSMGVTPENIILCDTKGVIYKGRTERMNKWKEEHAVDTPHRSLYDALHGADVFIGLSAKGAMNQEMVKAMASKPIIFAMANPDPEITPEEVKSVRLDAITATGRSDYSNQVNNVMCFPYIFRGALDVSATAINSEMKIAAAHAIAELAREEITEEVSAAYAGRRWEFGPDYIIPVPFDSRLIQIVSVAVAKAAMESGVARTPIEEFRDYNTTLVTRLNPNNHLMSLFFENLKHSPKNIIFAEGGEEEVIQAALQWKFQGYGTPILVGHEHIIEGILQQNMGISAKDVGIKITNAALNNNTAQYIEYLYARLQRKGFMRRDCARLVNRDRNIFGSIMLEHGEADAMVTGLTRSYLATLEDVNKVIDPRVGQQLFALSVLTNKERTIFVADTAINEMPSSEQLADIAIQTAEEVRKMGYEPRVAFISFSNFGNPLREKAARIREAVSIMSQRNVDFEYDGEMAANVALNAELLKLYPFCKLSKPANILIMPALHSSNISSKLLQEFGGTTLMGPILCGLKKQVQILQMGSTVSDILNISAIAANRSGYIAK